MQIQHALTVQIDLTEKIEYDSSPLFELGHHIFFMFILLSVCMLCDVLKPVIVCFH